MAPADAILLAALRGARHRYRMPPLPAELETARSAGPEMALAFTLEAARLAHDGAAPPPAGARELFTTSLAAVLRQALAQEGGDPAFQALVLRSGDPQVAEYARLLAQRTADRRSIRAAVLALAHPGKLRDLPVGPQRTALERLLQLLAADDWPALHIALETPPPALARLARASELEGLPEVRRYVALCEQRGPSAGSVAAATQGRAAARTGAAAELATVTAFRQIAQRLDRQAGGAGGHRVVRGLRTPPGFPGDAEKAKDEWDAAITRAVNGVEEIVLLAEVKAAPSAATNDFARLRRGLERLAQAPDGPPWRFVTADGEVRLASQSLRGLQPQGRQLPPHVIYCCTAPPEPQPQVLGAAAKAVLLGEPAGLAFALRVARGESPPDCELEEVWAALPTAPRLRAALHQFDTARLAREAMLHPDDLLEAVDAGG